MCYALLLFSLVAIPVGVQAHIYSYTEATADTGGNTVGSGVSIEVGSARSFVRVSNTQGSSTVHIKTEVNGTVREETVKDDSGHIDVVVQADAHKAHIEVIKGSPAAVIHTGIPASSSISAVQPVSLITVVREPETQGIVQRIFSWLGGLLGFLR
jgi:hypothetical protein